jgi:conjugative transfer signal peptidase TraF
MTKTQVAVFTVWGSVAVLLAADAAGIRINLTESAPRGIWIMDKSQKLERGSLVAVCPPSSLAVATLAARSILSPGDCIGTEAQSLLKPVGAVSGDLVVIREGMPVLVNGIELPNTAASDKLPSWPAGTYQVQPGFVWLFSTYSERSFDSRYFGPVPVENIRGVTTPLLVDGEISDMTRGITDD